MADEEVSTKFFTSGTILGVSVGTILAIILTNIDPQTQLTESLIGAVATVTAVIDKLVQKRELKKEHERLNKEAEEKKNRLQLEQEEEKRRTEKGIQEAIAHTNEYLKNPVTPATHQALLDKLGDLQLRHIETIQYNPGRPPER
jgi:mannitol-specific phosphotransferase system IIBC component